jgi:hypothetical protein
MAINQTRRDIKCLPSALNSLNQLTLSEAGMRVPSNRRTFRVWESRAAQITPVASAVSGDRRFQTRLSPKPMKMR